jgi:hypothetical protein
LERNIVVFGKIFWWGCFAPDAAGDVFIGVKMGFDWRRWVKRMVNFKKNLQKIIQNT